MTQSAQRGGGGKRDFREEKKKKKNDIPKRHQPFKKHRRGQQRGTGKFTKKGGEGDPNRVSQKREKKVRRR